MGFATREGTARFAARFPAHAANGFFRTAQGLTVSSLGIGTYLGGMDEEADRGYREAVAAAVRGGINFIDTSLNYRHQRSERAVGAALQALFEAGEVRRDEIVVCTKAGYLTPGAVPEDLGREQVVGGMHSMEPAFLDDQLARSRRNLGLETIDVFYLHNPETQLQFVAQEEFLARAAAAFERLERLAGEGLIRFHGMATWQGFRQAAPGEGALPLVRLAGLAAAAGGERHRFRFIQLPLNLAMREAVTARPEFADGSALSVPEAAARLGISVIASAPLLQGRLTRGLPAELGARLPGPASGAQLALQFTRSAPGIAVALAGMGRAAHVAENLGLAAFPPAAAGRILALCQAAE